MDLHLPYIYQDMDRRGNRRLFVRRYGRKIRIREKLGTPAFLTAYNSAVASLDRPNRTAPTIKPAATATLGWLAASYFGSVEFQRLDFVSQRRRRTIIEECLAEVRAPGTADMMRDCPVAALSSAHIKMLRDRRADTPGTANNRKKYLSAMFGWAVENDLMKSNPARDVRRIRYATDGFHTWTVEEVARFVERHPVGTKACLALALLLFLGVRRGDLVKLGPGMVEAGTIRMIPRKTRHKRVEASYKPILPVLADIIARSPTGPFTYLATRDVRRSPRLVLGTGLPIVAVRRRFRDQRTVCARPARRSLPRPAPPIGSSWRSTIGPPKSRRRATPARPIVSASPPVEWDCLENKH